jgi:hypothetical protein
MQRYFFHLEGPARATDDTGEEFASVEDAAYHAQRLAWGLPINRRPSSSVARIVMTDEGGREVVTVPIRDRYCSSM